MGCVHVDEHQPVSVLGQDVYAMQLGERIAQRMRLLGSGRGWLGDPGGVGAQPRGGGRNRMLDIAWGGLQWSAGRRTQRVVKGHARLQVAPGGRHLGRGLGGLARHARRRKARGQRLAARQCGLAGREHGLKHRLPFTEAHLGLGRVHVDIHQLGVEGQGDDRRGLSISVQHVGIGHAQGLDEQSVAHRPAIHKEVLLLRSSRDGRGHLQPGFKSQRPALFVDPSKAGLIEVQDLRHPPAGFSRSEPHHDPVLMTELPLNGWLDECLANKGLAGMAPFGGRCLEESAPRRHGMKERLNIHRGAHAAGCRRHRPAPAPVADLACMLGLCGAAGERELRHRCHRGQGLTTKAVAENVLEILHRANLARGVPRHRQAELVGGNAMAIVLHTNATNATVFQGQADALRPTVHGVLEQFFDNRCRPLDDLSGRNLADEQVWKECDRGHARGYISRDLASGGFWAR